MRYSALLLLLLLLALLAVTTACGAAPAGSQATVPPAPPTAAPTTPTPAAVAASPGEQTFTRLGCGGCHRVDTPGTGPDLRGVFGRAQRLEGGATVVVDEPYLRESILNPTAQVVAGYLPAMPGYGSQMTASELDQIVKYLKALKAPGAVN